MPGKRPLNLPKPNPEPAAGSLLLRRLDQAAIAALTLLPLVSIGVYWLAHGGGGRLIEIDRAPRQTASFQIDINEADWQGRTSL
jgi:hypothetical protein